MKRLITQAELRKILNVDRKRVHELAKTDFAEAVVGGKIDRDHPVVAAYIAVARNDSGITLPPPPPPPPVKVEIDEFYTDSTGLPSTDYLAGTDIEELGDMSLRDIANKFGTVALLRDWLDARKKIVDISEKEIKNSKLRNELIPRMYVEKFVIQQFERTNINLLNDAPKSIAADILSIYKAGGALEQAELAAEAVISTHITAGKEQVNNMMGAI